MTHPVHQPPHTPRSAVDEGDEQNPNHLPVEPEMGTKIPEVPGARPSDGGTESAD